MALWEFLTLALMVGSAVGYQTFQNQIPNGNNVPHPCKVNFMWPGVGHENRLGGGKNNPFGVDFKESGYWWSSDLCRKDSDGDGWTNGQELGDPDCTWTAGQVPSRITDITHPGICDTSNDPSCDNSWVDCEEEDFFCPRINQSDVKYIDMPFKEHTIPATETNYFCMTFDLPTDQDYHVIANEPIIDNANVLHHILVFGCESDNADIPEPIQCGMEAKESGDCGTIIGLWAVGSPGLCYRNDIGYRIGQNSFKKVKLEIHYNNPLIQSGQKDKSGIRLYYQPVKPESYDMTTLTIGARIIDLPPGQPREKVTSVCSGGCTRSMVMKDAKIYGALNHMHYLGTSMKIELFRQGSKIADITNEDFYSYDSPVVHTHEPSLDLRAGDEIRTTCIYNTMSTDRFTFFGDATSDEMCYGFLFVYPKDAFQFETCMTWGELDICQLYTGTPLQTPVGACDWGAFTHVDDNYRPQWIVEAERYCPVDGTCRPKCKELVKSMMKDPCMHKDAVALVTWRLSETNPNSLTRINACRGELNAEMEHGGDDHDGKDDGHGGTCTWDECAWMCPMDDHDSYSTASGVVANMAAILAAGLSALALSRF